MKYYEDDDYLKIVQDLINTPEVQQLKNYIQHHDNDRYTHVIAVSYRSYVLAKHMGMDAISVARAGILHDLFYYDWRTSHYSMSTHAFVHPLVAVDAAKKITTLTALEEEIIKTHMYPVGCGQRPSSKEAWLLDAVDDYEAIREGVHGMALRFSAHFRKPKLSQSKIVNR